MHRQLIAAFVAVIVFPTAIIAVYSLERSSEILIDMARLERLRGVSARATTAVRLLTDVRADLEFASHSFSLRRYLNAGSEPERGLALREVERVFAAFLARWGEKYKRLCLLDSAGQEVSCVRMANGTPAPAPPAELANRSAQPFFAGAMSLRAIPGEQSVYVSEVEVDPPGSSDDRDATPVLRCATALQTDSGLLDGVIVFDALVAPILSALQSPADGGGGVTIVVDREGRYLLHPDPARSFAHLRGAAGSLRSERPRDAAVILDQFSGTLYASADRPDSLQVFARVRPPGQSNVVWTLIDEQSLDTILADVRHARRVILLVAALSLATAVAAALAITRGIVRPIGALARAAEAIRRGELDASLPAADRPDEVGVLTRAFAQMVERVRSLVGTLQQRVAELERSDAALRAGDRRLRQMIDNNLAGMLFVDLSGTIVEANDAFLRIAGYDRDDLRAGRVIPDEMTPPEYREVTAQAIAEARARGACAPYEKEYVRKDGSRVQVLIGITLVDAARDQAVVFVLDQTARKQAEADRQARLVAETANRAKSDFLARMSHELRTPLNAILGFTQLLKWEPGLNERSRAGLAAIQQGSEHLLQLIVDLLDMARIEAGRFSLDPQPMNLEHLLTGVREIIGMRAQQRSLHFVTEIASGLPRQLRCDELRLRQVLLNLLGNAMKFTDAGEVRLRVQATPASGGCVRLRFDVSDTGIGMAREDVARLFQAFEQVGDARRHAGGTGLGLAISQQIVQQMGGHIEVESEPGAGSRFGFEVELAVIEDSRSEPGPSQTLPTGYAGPRRSILVVDNEALNRELLVELVAGRGFEVREAADGEQALAAMQSLRPDLVLMDMAMPVLDGLETTWRLRRTPELSQIRVICISANAAESSRRAALAAGADAFVTKPVDMGRLLALIGELLGLRWVADESHPAAELSGKTLAG
ncbi:ATP-binding protein [Piscinibacter sp.]|uniref:ATP-binding protein n=1 Tax=Piscinibacter sp. TaxID=1903157 RepID=UPI002F3F2303